ncbi:flavin reductase family protein [Kitasatospora sp. NPDC059408]|uniref:flavin reductase family protein n=1 Tax=Kitasatospora sp. NPDC059408 TaxID=3346823 RepID=UPI0036A52198
MPESPMLAEPAPALFRSVLGRFATGVAALTALAGDAPVGMAVNSFASVSLTPPLVSFCVAHRSTTWPALRASGRLCVNFLAEHQEPLSRRLAGAAAERFRGVAWSGSPNGLPVLDGVLGWLECTIEDEHRAGDHDIVVARVDSLWARPDGEPLVFFRGGYGGFLRRD